MPFRELRAMSGVRIRQVPPRDDGGDDEGKQSRAWVLGLSQTIDKRQ